MRMRVRLTGIGQNASLFLQKHADCGDRFLKRKTFCLKNKEKRWEGLRFPYLGPPMTLSLDWFILFNSDSDISSTLPLYPPLWAILHQIICHHESSSMSSRRKVHAKSWKRSHEALKANPFLIYSPKLKLFFRTREREGGEMQTLCLLSKKKKRKRKRKRERTQRKRRYIEETLVLNRKNENFVTEDNSSI